MRYKYDRHREMYVTGKTLEEECTPEGDAADAATMVKIFKWMFIVFVGMVVGGWILMAFE